MPSTLISEIRCCLAGIEARGFIFGPPIALAIGAKFIPLRKPRKLPGNHVYLLCIHLIKCALFFCGTNVSMIWKTRPHGVLPF